MKKLRVLDLFSGIGGFSLGLERAGGFETVAFCEIEEFPRKVLKKRWPDVPCFEDVRKLRVEDVGSVDVIAEASPAKTLATPGSGEEYMQSEASSGLNLSASLAKFDPASQSLKTLGRWPEGDSAPFSLDLPRSGMMRNGEIFPQPSWALRISAPESGFLPTPSGVNGGRNHTSGRLDEWGGSSNPFRGTEIGKVHCPSFEGWMMGYPVLWHRLTDIGTP